MVEQTHKRPAILDVVALLGERRDLKLQSGQVGTVLEILDPDNVLVEFSDEEGRAFAVAPCAASDVLVLHYVPETA
jgi:Domain of unknown function (DUF4926)